MSKSIIELYYTLNLFQTRNIKYCFKQLNIIDDIHQLILNFLICPNCNILYNDDNECWCWYKYNIFIT